MPSHLVIFLAVALVAEVIGTITGFGATTILLPVASLMYPLPIAIAYSALFHFLGTLWRSAFFARRVNWRIALTFGIPSLILSYVGARLLTVINPQLVSYILGVALIAYAAYSLVKHRLALPRRTGYLIGGGMVTGFLAGLIGTAGAIRGAFLSAWKLPKEVYLGTGAVMGLGADVVRLVAYHQTGLLVATWQLVAIFLIVALGGTYIGARLVKSAPAPLFTKIVLAGLILAGVRFLIL